jgi:alginate O-acetyltransferase complex protein AlgI
MAFSSLVFFFCFLPAFLAVYYAVPERFRNAVALAGSYLFYSWGAPVCAVGLFLSCAMDYLAVRAIDRLPASRSLARRAILTAIIVFNLAGLAYFKYANFFVEQFNAAVACMGGRPMHWSPVLLPLGISFFTFQKLSYILDTCRGTTQPARSLWEYCLYVALFPKLTAGPIVRYHDIAWQLRGRRHSVEQFFNGLWRFALGLARKLLVATPLAHVADTVFAAPNGILPPGHAWLGALAYAMQIYFDFAGYSDMAIGLGRMMGFGILENFDRPYLAAGFGDFWKRWHISLGDFMREYVYIPLGGNRGTRWRTYLNLWTVFLISGLWHGANWTFVLWGIYHGTFLTLDRILAETRLARARRFIGVPLTFVLVCVGWVLFRSASLAQAGNYLLSMAGAFADDPTPAPFVCMDPRTVAALVVAATISWVPLRQSGLARIRVAMGTPWFEAVRSAALLLLLGLSVLALASLDFSPFIYFQF